jgi:hypothetical protein
MFAVLCLFVCFNQERIKQVMATRMPKRQVAISMRSRAFMAGEGLEASVEEGVKKEPEDGSNKKGGGY